MPSERFRSYGMGLYCNNLCKFQGVFLGIVKSKEHKLAVRAGSGWCLEAVLICRPLRKDWDPQTPGVCGNNKNGDLLGGILNLITDFGMIALPIPI